MLNSLQAASRLLTRASLALFTGVVLLLIQSAFWSNRVSAWMQAIILAVALLSYFRPRYGLLALAVLVPLGQVGSRTLDSQMRGAEALVLAFLAGALVRGWTLREFRTFPSTRLEIAALVFGFVVAASCVEQIWLMQIQRDFVSLFAQDLLNHASRYYITSSRGFGLLYRTMLLLEGMALLLYTAKCVREEPPFGGRLATAIVVGAVATATLTLWSVTAELLATRQAQARFVEFFASQRWTVHVSDINAAGSFFAMAMFTAFGMAAGRSRHQILWYATGCVLAATTWMTHSRTAVAAVLLIGVCIAAAAMIGRIIGVLRAVALAATASVVAAVALWHYLGPEYFGAGAKSAIRIRWLFLGVTWRMLLDQPIFGIGIGQFFLWSNHFATPEMFDHYQRENAHNNFAQIAGELGFLGLASFLFVLLIALWRRGTERLIPVAALPAALGVIAFILTWLGGHPLLVAEVAYPFWITLGIVAALVQPDFKRMPSSSAVIATTVAVLVVSIPFRVTAKSAELDFSRITYGLSAKRLMPSRARYFVPANQSRLEFPLRARGATDTEPIDVDVFVDGLPSETVSLTDRNWRKVGISLPQDTSRRFHQIDLRIKADTLDQVDPGRSSVEVGKWEIISKPNG